MLKVEIHDDKIKKKAMKAVSGISGMESQHPIIFVHWHGNYPLFSFSAFKIKIKRQTKKQEKEKIAMRAKLLSFTQFRSYNINGSLSLIFSDILRLYLKYCFRG